jgi:hypothetical protein
MENEAFKAKPYPYLHTVKVSRHQAKRVTDTNLRYREPKIRSMISNVLNKQPNVISKDHPLHQIMIEMPSRERKAACNNVSL